MINIQQGNILFYDFIIASLLLIVIIASVNAEAETQSQRVTGVRTRSVRNTSDKTMGHKRHDKKHHKKGCCPAGCLSCDSCGRVKKSVKVRRLCLMRNRPGCIKQNRCCKKTTTCRGGFCKTTRRMCKWIGKRYIRKNCHKDE